MAKKKCYRRCVSLSKSKTVLVDERCLLRVREQEAPAKERGCSTVRILCIGCCVGSADVVIFCVTQETYFLFSCPPALALQEEELDASLIALVAREDLLRWRNAVTGRGVPTKVGKDEGVSVLDTCPASPSLAEP